MTLPRFLAAGDAALVVEYGEVIDPVLIAAVQRLDRRLAAAHVPGVIETVPSFRSLMVHYDPLATSQAQVIAAIQGLEADDPTAASEPGRAWRLPVCYEAGFAPDLADVAAATGLAPEAVTAAHAGNGFTVAVVGFLPGCPFLAALPDNFNLPRRTAPRTRVPAGSVAVAQKLSVIYPTESPGGWHLIGNCPVPLFDARWDRPALLAPADRIRFQPIDAEEHGRILAAARAGDYDPRRDCVDGAAT
ncbi:MAG TPA: 5-oxoprolinase subunit PxpB [Aliidongia sp.]|uniref:5-oxoprolinase subunit PxpB n=1 Tax=Aliidongia sp. TaxID=1914230 RepID=UPI002DDCD72D|nr:5-oxoprolinase subunit PxpB [Aliidongia sp.]HEV2675245.1 5-oxoprolinase subunit PxpB [Aliidongia sp.]